MFGEKDLRFQVLKTDLGSDVSVRTLRTPVPGGWLILHAAPMGTALTFYPDPSHQWDGKTLEVDG